MSDEVNHPSHYTRGKIECIEFIEDQKLDFCSGNAVKYICRAGHKDPSKEVQDLEKATWYLMRKLAVLRGSPPRPNDMPLPKEKTLVPRLVEKKKPTAEQIAKILAMRGISYSTYYYRLKSGWTMSDALNTPVAQRKKARKKK